MLNCAGTFQHGSVWYTGSDIKCERLSVLCMLSTLFPMCDINHMNLKAKELAKIILTSLLLVVFSSFAYGQATPSPTPEGIQTEELRRELREESKKTAELEKATQELRSQNAVLTKQLDWLTPIAALISLVLLSGTITSLISWNTDRVRSRDTYKMALEKDKAVGEREKVVYERQDELFSLSLKKDQESSERDRHIFAQSTETLNLVNQTLKLAKDASERASKNLEDKLNRKHDELEQDAIDLIEDSKAYKNFKVLVEDSNSKSNLQTLALEIAGLQNNQNILEKEVALHPYCCFIRGMEFHLSQHVKPAIKFWKQAKDHPRVSDSLKIMALFWIGYEQNNKGEFEDAASNFEVAASVAKGALKYELERIQLESKFFDTKRFSPESVLPEMESLYKRINDADKSDEIQKASSSIAGTLGNIYYQLGNELLSKGREEDATRYYQKAKETFANAPIRNKWNWFGYGEACYSLKEYEEAEDCFLNKVKPEAEFEYSTRSEPRTKVLGQTTVLICSIRVQSLHENVTTLFNLIKATLGSVDRNVTVYSPFQRRNVLKEVFLEDLNAIMNEFERVS